MKNQTAISEQDVETLIREHLPEIVRRDPSFRQWVLEVAAEQFADKAETDSRFERLLAEWREERQAQRAEWKEYQAQMERRWEEQRAEWKGYQAQMERRWEEQRAEWREYQAQMEERWRGFLEGYERRWEEQRAQWREYQAQMERRWEEQRTEWREYRDQMERRWEEQRAEGERRWEEQRAQMEQRLEKHRAEWQEYRAQMERRWEEQRAEGERRWQEQRAQWERHWKELLDHYERRWEEHRAESEKRFQQMLRRIDIGISAIGARWGIFAESAFRNGIQAILEESFGVQVLHYQGYDSNGEIFGHPDQVELDLIIKDGLLIICEIKSSMSRSDMYTFERKLRFYERQEGCQAHRRIVISPMVEEKALQVAQKLGIEVYSHADDVLL